METKEANSSTTAEIINNSNCSDLFGGFKICNGIRELLPPKVRICIHRRNDLQKRVKQKQQTYIISATKVTGAIGNRYSKE